jgi:hypothetical protein
MYHLHSNGACCFYEVIDTGVHGLILSNQDRTGKQAKDELWENPDRGGFYL